MSLINMLESTGIETWINLDSLLACVFIAEKMTGRQLQGHIFRAGASSKIYQPSQNLRNDFSRT
jgi:hypothetical protein